MLNPHKFIPQIINEALGEASALFMSQQCKGTEIVMPERELSRISKKLSKLIIANLYKEEKKHTLSKDCWCNPKVEDYSKLKCQDCGGLEL